MFNNTTHSPSANLTTTTADPQDSPDVVRARTIYYSGFWIVGQLTIMCNGLLAFVLLRYKKIRQESNNRPIVASLALSDVVQGTAYLSCAICFFTDPTMDHVTPLQCMLFAHVIFFSIGPILMPQCLVAVSVDRLLCVLNPRAYMRLGSWYVCFQALWPWVSVGAMYASMWGLALRAWVDFKTGGKVICYRELLVMSNSWIYMFDFCQAVVPLAAVAIYCVVIAAFMRSKTSEFEGVAQDEREREARITKTLGLMSMCTFLLFSVPSFAQAIIHYVPELQTPENTFQLAVLNNVFSLTEAVHSIGNFSIYVWRADDVKRKMLGLLGLRCAKIDADATNGKDLKSAIPISKIQTQNKSQNGQMSTVD